MLLIEQICKIGSGFGFQKLYYFIQWTFWIRREWTMILVDHKIEIQIPETDKVIYVGCLKEMVAVEMSDFVENGVDLH